MNIHAPENLSGRLNKRIILQQPVSVADGAGGFTITWQDVASLWGEITLQRSLESFLHDKLTMQNMQRITIRYRSDVLANMRFIHASRVFWITGIVDTDQQKQVLHISVREE